MDNRAFVPESTPQRPSLALRRHIKAPAERVFRAWTEAAHLSRWFCPADCAIEETTVDARVGGAYRIAMRQISGDRRGELHCVIGTYREVTPPRRLVFTWAWYTTPERQSLVTVDIVPKDDGALLTLTHEQFADAPARDRHQVGWTAALEKLAADLEA